MTFFGEIDPAHFITGPAKILSSNKNKNLQEIPIELLIWNAKDRNIGHISLYLPDQYLYVSFWPDETVHAGNATKYVSSTRNTHAEDKVAEGRVEDEKIEETVLLDISLLESEWNDMIKKKQKYSLALFNCADAVLNVLTAANDHFNANTTGIPGSILTAFDPGKRKILAIRSRIENFKTNGVFNALTRFVKS